MKDKNLPNLPPSNDEYWEDSEKIVSKPVSIKICATHTKENWYTHVGYVDNKDGTISCKYCAWGTMMPGYMRVKDEKIIDLRNLSRR